VRGEGELGGFGRESKYQESKWKREKCRLKFRNWIDDVGWVVIIARE
jgi:hypothetical protein